MIQSDHPVCICLLSAMPPPTLSLSLRVFPVLAKMPLHMAHYRNGVAGGSRCHATRRVRVTPRWASQRKRCSKLTLRSPPCATRCLSVCVCASLCVCVCVCEGPAMNHASCSPKNGGSLRNGSEVPQGLQPHPEGKQTSEKLTNRRRSCRRRSMGP